MLLPALGKAREKARAISCTGNMRQIGLSLNIYVNENDDALPDNNGDTSAKSFYHFLIRTDRYIGLGKLRLQGYGGVDSNGNVVWPKGKPKVFYCTSSESSPYGSTEPYFWGKSTDNLTTTYGYVDPYRAYTSCWWYVTRDGAAYKALEADYNSTTQLNSGKVSVVAKANYPIVLDFFGQAGLSDTRRGGILASHGDRINLCYIDGSVRSAKITNAMFLEGRRKDETIFVPVFTRWAQGGAN